jgi:hypothetical protein
MLFFNSGAICGIGHKYSFTKMFSGLAGVSEKIFF